MVLNEGSGSDDKNLEELMCPLKARGFYAKYEPLEVLGKGASSVVRRVINKRTGDEFAVKIIDVSTEKLSVHQVDELKTSTQREIDILKQCAGHRNIIRLHDSYITNIFIFLVFEVCSNGELFDLLTSVVKFSEKRTRIIMKQLLDAVSHMHELHIVHRDLKPENILLDSDMVVKVSDFGFATQVETDDELTELCGTPGYLAPEVLIVSMYENQPGYGKPVDMWACGVIMYTLLCGAPPFWHRKQMQMLRMIMAGRYSMNTPVWAEASEEAKDLIKSFLTVNPQERITVQGALDHSFFRIEEQKRTDFNAKRMFRCVVMATLFWIRVRRQYLNPPPLSIDALRTQPYSYKQLRRTIDAVAFNVYKHWVKRGENQNRAAMFEILPKGLRLRERHISENQRATDTVK